MYNLGFFGSPNFSSFLLEKILTDKELKKKINLKYVVTQPDRPVGRKQIITPTPVKSIALNYKDIEVITDIKDKKLNLKKIDIALVFAYAKIIPTELLKLPKYGFWCVHPSLLPIHRGTSPMATALINGDKITGVTIIKMDEKIDHGPIIDQQSLTIENNNKRPEIEEKLADLSFQLFKKIVINNDDLSKLKLIPQNDSQASYTKKLTKQDGFVVYEELRKSINNQQLPIANSILFNLFRGLYPWPGLWTILPNGKRLKIIDMNFINNKIVLKKVQLEGKKEINFDEFIKYNRI